MSQGTEATVGSHAAGKATPPTGRGRWHRRTALLPLGYLAGIAVLGLVHPFVPAWWWLGVHLLLLGAVSNAILLWSAHFTVAVLRVQAPASRRPEAARLALLNAGVLAVLAAGHDALGWVGVAGATAVFAAVTWHLAWLVGRLRVALPARFSVTVHYYLAATLALLTAVPVGGWMLVVHDAARPRLVLFHAHVNLFGWVVLTVLGTLVTLWPTVLRTRMVDDAVPAARKALPVAVSGLSLLGLAVLAWQPWLAAGGLGLFAVAVGTAAWPALSTARRKPPGSFATWSMAAAGVWLLVALGVDAWVLLSAPDPANAADRFHLVLVPLLVGFVAQVLLGALAYLMPVGLGGGPALVRQRTAALERHWPQRVVMGNLALVIFVLPATPSYVRITTSTLVLVALVQFLIPAVRVLVTARR